METDTQRLLHTFAALADLGQEIADTGDFEEMLRASFHLLLGSLAIRRGGVAEYDRDGCRLRVIASRGLGETPELALPCSNENERRWASLGSSLSLADAKDEAAKFLADYTDVLAAAKIDLLIPLVVRERLIGVVLLGEKATGEKLTEGDLEIVGVLARHLGVGIHSHRLLEEVEHKADENRRLYDGLRKIIAREMGWTDDAVEGIAIAGYLHDIGKLIVDLNVINSPERFNAKDSKEMSRHPAAGYEILSPISHPYADIPLMARYHHERIDGNGYPDGLKGDEIPAGAKIVTLADSFDAMTTDRPYRKHLPLADVLEDFRVNTGTQFEPAVVCAFCRAFLKEIEGTSKEKRLIKLLGKNYDNVESVSPLLTQLISDLDGNGDARPAGAVGH